MGRILTDSRSTQIYDEHTVGIVNYKQEGAVRGIIQDRIAWG